MLDIIIIGSGPAGLTAAIYAKRAQLNAVVVEKEYLGTGQIAESSLVDNYPGMPQTDVNAIMAMSLKLLILYMRQAVSIEIWE